MARVCELLLLVLLAMVITACNCQITPATSSSPGPNTTTTVSTTAEGTTKASGAGPLMTSHPISLMVFFIPFLAIPRIFG